MSPRSGKTSQGTLPQTPIFRSVRGTFTAPTGAISRQPYIFFAYRIVGDQVQAVLSQLPGWVTTDRFDILANTDGDPAKDTKGQMRLMMRSLLAERFKMATHYETRQVPILAAVLVKPGETGLQLQAHAADAACSTAVATASGPEAQVPVGAGFPTLCGGFVDMPPSAPGRRRVGARNVTMTFIANGLSDFGNLGRPVVDRTGLSGTIDMVVEWVPEASGSNTASPDFHPDLSGPTFLEAVKEQLGLRLESQKGPSEFLVIDHIEHPTVN
jgi:uncharacterized protein (TIGR03435 family)